MKVNPACRVCRRRFRTKHDPEAPARHCQNPACSWCVYCVADKKAECQRAKGGQ